MLSTKHLVILHILAGLDITFRSPRFTTHEFKQAFSDLQRLGYIQVVRGLPNGQAKPLAAGFVVTPCGQEVLKYYEHTT